MPRKHSHCSYCGASFGEISTWPRTCGGCQAVSYLNPIPVAVLLLPVDGGVLCIRRAIEPGKGRLALPGGFVDAGEPWQAAAARELWEEVGIRIDAGEVRHFQTVSSPAADNILLIFGQARERTLAELPPFAPNAETSERVVLRDAEELAFPLHTAAVREFLMVKGWRRRLLTVFVPRSAFRVPRWEVRPLILAQAQ